MMMQEAVFMQAFIPRRLDEVEYEHIERESKRAGVTVVVHCRSAAAAAAAAADDDDDDEDEEDDDDDDDDDG